MSGGYVKRILLDKGKLLLKDNVDNVISEYVSIKKKKFSIINKNTEQNFQSIEVLDVKIINSNALPKDVFSVSEKIGLNFTFKVNKIRNNCI